MILNASALNGSVSSARRSSSSMPFTSMPVTGGMAGGRGVEPVADHVDGAVEVGADAVHLVDEADAGHAVLVGLTPHRLRLRLHTGHRVEHGDRAVEHPQRPLDFDGEVDVAGRVDDVD